ncbi:MAG: hypoxanthine phosphoribosyltransferase [Candidatus Xenobia bacterium]
MLEPMKAVGTMADDLEEILIPADRIAERVAELGHQISTDYAGKEITLLAILCGALPFLSDLARHITCQTTIDFMVVSRYGGSTPGDLRIVKDLEQPLKGRDVLIVEDIVDEGETLHRLMQVLQLREPRSLQVVTIFDKPHHRKTGVVPDYNGFEVPDRFVVGYGLDFKQRYRNLPFLATLKGV